MFELVEDSSPIIPVPTFINRHIILDLVEMVEKDDRECALLILVSLPYLLDFLIAVDFLGCDNLKTVLEKKVRDKICDSNWREVFNYIKHIPGLANTIKHSMEPICTKLLKLSGMDSCPLTMEELENPYQQDYVQLNFIKHIPDLDNIIKHSIKPFCTKLVGNDSLYMEEPYQQFTPDLIKLMLKDDSLGNYFKFWILKNWFFENIEERELQMLKIEEEMEEEFDAMWKICFERQ